MRKYAKKLLSLLLAGVMAFGTAAALAEEPAVEATGLATVQTDKGWLLGSVTDGVCIFKGIPYAKAERFQMPEDPDPWNTLRVAMVYGESCPNGGTIVSMADYLTPSGTDSQPNETCQYLNVWTTSMDTEAKKPVIFWIHGGGWSSGGSNELAYYDGANLAASQDVVFVSINHRLNVLGYTDLSAYGEEYKYSGNVGVADMVKALEWVNKNIALFGGDPNNVTIVGQSGGGAKVTVLSAIPSAEGLFNKVVMCSNGGSLGTPQADAQAAGVALVEKAKATYGLTSDEEALEKLKTISYDELYSLSNGTGVGAGPVVDGDFYPETVITDGKMIEAASDVPLMITTTYAENMLNLSYLSVSLCAGMVTGNLENPDQFLATYSKTYATDATTRAQLEAKFGDRTDEVLNIFRTAYPGHDDFDLLWIHTGHLYDRAVEVANARLAGGGAPIYRAMFAFEFPVFGGCPAWHTGGDLPFLFANIDKVDYLVRGDEDAAWKLSNEAATALCNFARTGNPSQDGLEWPAYTEANKAIMVFDHESEVRVDFDTELRTYLEYNDGFSGAAEAQRGR